MTHPLIGTIQDMQIEEKNEEGWLLKHDWGKAILPLDRVPEDKTIQKMTVFLFKGENNQMLATPALPVLEVGTFGWGTVTKIEPKLGAFVDIGTDFDVLLPKDDLPAVEAVWPIPEDQVYLRMKKDSKDRLLLIPAKAHEQEDLFTDAADAGLNDHVKGHIIQVGREGSVMVTEESYRGFIHHSERAKEPRLGQEVSGRIIEVKADGTLNVSLLPLKQERMDEDAAKIFAYLEAHNGEIPIGNKSDPRVIKNTFGMSKSAFKRAVGKLFKEKKITPEDERIVQVKK